MKYWRSFLNFLSLLTSRASLATRLAWLALCLSAMGAATSVLVATLWLSSIASAEQEKELEKDLNNFSAIITSSLEQYDFARLDDLGLVFAQDNKLIQDFEIWHFDGLRMMSYGKYMPDPLLEVIDPTIHFHKVVSNEHTKHLGTLRYRLAPAHTFNQMHNNLLVTALMIVMSCLFTALMMQKLLKNYLAIPLSQLTVHMQNLSLNQPELTVKPVKGAARELRLLYSSFGNMAERILNQATTDPITGLKNRIYLERCLREAKNHPKNTYAILLFDLDHFKRINDNYGHPTGDYLLKAIAERLNILMDEGTELIRMGGDEFTIWFSNHSAERVPKSLVRSIYETMEQPFVLDNNRVVNVRMSGGFARYPNDVSTISDLLKAADLALYQTKEKRNGNVTYYTSDLADKSTEWMEIADLLRYQLSHGSLTFVFQPIVYASNRLLWGHEMLLRLIRSDGHIYDTEVVMQVASQLGLCGAIVESTIKNALIALVNKLPEGDLTINMSPEQVVMLSPERIGELLKPIAQELRNRLVIELTEQSLLDKRDVLTPIVHLHRLGYRIALDDFGSGYSSMSCLSSFPLSIVKMDKSLIQDVLTQKNKQDLLSCLTYTSHKMGFLVIAEGIETQAQYEMVNSLGCDLTQGYYFGRPMRLDKKTSLPLK